jgi:hypothetical protein
MKSFRLHTGPKGESERAREMAMESLCTSMPMNRTAPEQEEGEEG